MSELLTGAIARASSAIRGLLSLARIVRSTAGAGAHVELETSALADDRTQAWQPYGLQARPKPGAIAVQAALGGRQETVATLLVHDARYHIALAEGEVTILDDLGQKVHLTRTGIVVEAPLIKLGESATLWAARVTDPVGASASMTTWMTQVSGYINGTVPGTVLPTLPTSIGTITGGSTQTKIE